MDSLSLDIRELSKVFKNRIVLDKISIEICAGEIFVLTGNSGEGKSTFLKILAGIEDYTGSIEIISSPLPFKQCIAYLPQQNALWDNMTVLDNITLFRELKFKEDKKNAYNRVLPLVKSLGINKLIDRFPSNLSTGEQQRVSFARALAAERSIYLLDEVTANLDLYNKEIILNIIKQLSVEKKIVIVVTHDMFFAKNLSNTYFNLSNGKFQVCYFS